MSVEDGKNLDMMVEGSTTPENKLKTQEYIIKDKKGNEICRSRVSKTEEVSKLTETRWVQIHSWTLLGPDGREVDMFEYIGVAVPVYEVKERFSYVHSKKQPKNNSVFIPELNTPEGISVALHEFGHMKQHEENPFFSEELFINEEKRNFKNSLLYLQRWPHVRTLLTEVMSHAETLKIKEKIPEDLLQEFDLLYEQALQKIMIKNAKEKSLYSSNTTHLDEADLAWQDEQVDAMEAEIEVIDKKFRDLLRVHEKAIRNILQAPVLLLEKDATSRALQWMRDLKDTYNIHFYSVVEERTEVVERLKSSLRSYHIDEGDLGNVGRYWGCMQVEN